MADISVAEEIFEQSFEVDVGGGNKYDKKLKITINALAGANYDTLISNDELKKDLLFMTEQPLTIRKGNEITINAEQKNNCKIYIVISARQA